MSRSKVTFQLRLDENGNPDGRKRYARLPPPADDLPYTLRFVITGGSRAANEPVLFCNYHSDEDFVRAHYHQYKFTCEPLHDCHVELRITKPGVFAYYVEFSVDGTDRKERSHVGSFVIDPRLDYMHGAGSSSLLPLSGICILTVIPKWLPIIARWEPFFKTFADTVYMKFLIKGYNMVHFAPLNQRGISNSPYAIYDQLAFSSDLYAEKHLEPKEKDRQLESMLEIIRRKYGIKSVTDVVWNHTACNSAWLEDHPEAGYNLKNTPHLRPAYVLDEALMRFSQDLEPVHHCNPQVRTEAELEQVMSLWRNEVYPQIKLWEFYVVDVADTVTAFRSHWARKDQFPYDKEKYNYINLAALSKQEKAEIVRKDALIDRKDGTRYAKSISLPSAVSFIAKLHADLGYPHVDPATLLEEILDEVNFVYYKEWEGDTACIHEQIKNRARYLRVADHGPRLGPISRENPLVDTYFTRLPVNERTSKYHPDEMKLANNGWIWNADPLINFATEGKAYLRREVIAWGDCVKLRYGNGPEDSPWLWKHMTEYTVKMARLFDGLRIDNCHSTPIHVASYLLDAARKERPDLYVFAELFTGSEEKDILFVSTLGINSLIREAMNAWDTAELSRLSHRHGGQPIGSLTISPEYLPLEMLGHGCDCFEEEETLIVDVYGSSPHALFMDCTHDNETPHQKRTAEDTLPNAAVVCMSDCAVGSVKGYDEIVPELLNVVTETRKYRIPDHQEGILPAKSILQVLHAKMAREGYHEIHVHQEHDFISIHRVHPVTHDGYLLVARSAFSSSYGDHLHSPIRLKNQKVRLMESASLCVNAGGSPVHSPEQSFMSMLQSPDTSHVFDPHALKVALTNLSIDHPEGSPDFSFSAEYPQTPSSFYHHLGIVPEEITASKKMAAKLKARIKHLGVITGLPSTLDFSTTYTDMVKVEVQEDADMLESILNMTPDFVPGSIVLYRTWVVGSGLDEQHERDVDSTLPSRYSSPAPPVIIDPKEFYLKELWGLLGCGRSREMMLKYMVKMGWDSFNASSLWFSGRDVEGCDWPYGLWDTIRDLDMEELNVALYRTGGEENDVFPGFGAYDVPGYGSLPYCGIQGFASCIIPVARYNDLGHPVYANIRAGFWMMEYIVGRLDKYTNFYPNLKHLMQWIRDRFDLVKKLPLSFVPKYFTLIVLMVYHGLKFRAIQIASPFGLKLTAYEAQGVQASTFESFVQTLVLTSFQMFGRVSTTGLFPVPYPFASGDTEKHIGSLGEPCLAAGLPHFSTHHMRCWGRDVFIALPGHLTLTGRYKEARSLLIAFASTLKHGLIPNLLDRGMFPRYNARDATWFWINAVQDYCKRSPEGNHFLTVKVSRRFPPWKRYRSGTPDYLVANDDLVHNSDDGDFGDVFVDPTDPRCYKFVSTVGEIIHEILDRHARGISFREWNAGPQLDHAMSSEGFNVNVGTRWKDGTGFVYGGSKFNCGTWMDKMGDSDKAGNKGVPATPRDGSAVEIVGLQYAALRWVSELSKDKSSHWKWTNVTLSDSSAVSYSEWVQMVKQSFEPYFFIPQDNKDKKFVEPRPDLINKHNIYKDTLDPRQEWCAYQLRPNFCVAMVVAPELFTPSHAIKALEMAKKWLVGPLGIKTLDPSDWGYRGNYDNSNDSNDPTIAHGHNYHQGPEWAWVFGYFLRAYLYFGLKTAKDKHALFRELQCLMKHAKSYIMDHKNNPYNGLPELTNANGDFCFDSCATQAWSSSVLIELCNELLQADAKQTGV